jgi:hypothetical protein
MKDDSYTFWGNFKSKKFFLAVFSIILFYPLVWSSKATSNELFLVITAVLGGYFTANVSQKNVEKKK